MSVNGCCCREVGSMRTECMAEGMGPLGYLGNKTMSYIENTLIRNIYGKINLQCIKVMS